MTTAQIAIPAVFLAFSALFVLSRVVRHRNAARAHGRHENGHTVHDGPPPAARRLPSARGRAAAFSELATPCPRCGVDHIGGCGMRPGPASLPAHLRPGVVLPSTPKLALAPALEPLPPWAGQPCICDTAGPNWCLAFHEQPEPDLTGEEAAALRERHAESLKRQEPIHLPPDPDLTITAGPGADEAYQDVVNAGMHDARRRPGGQTTGEIFEHLCEGTGCWCHSFRRLPAPPGWAVELNHGYSDNTEAVESMFTRAQADQVNAALAQAEASGQVAHG
jgi:hypothetical protein